MSACSEGDAASERRSSIDIGPTVTASGECTESVDPAGAELWLEPFARDDPLEVSGVASDSRGNALVTRASGELIKIDPAGRVLWSKPFGAVVATDAADSIYVAGTLAAPLELGAVRLSPLGDTDVYVVKLDASGAVQYGVRLGAEGNESVTGIAVDAAGNAVVSGSGLGTVKLGAGGETLWQSNVHGHIAIDSLGNVIVAGAFSRTLSFGAVSLASAGGQDVLIAKLDADGHPVFGLRFGDTGIEQRAQAVAVDGDDNVLVSGVFDGSLDFGGGVLSAPDAGCADAPTCRWGGFVVKLDASGVQVWSSARFPVSTLVGITTSSRNDVFVSGALPGDAAGQELPVLLAFNARGSELYAVQGWPGARAGAGHRVAVDPCDSVLWTLNVSASETASDGTFLAKLAPRAED
jgi:hypothetical protein